MIPAKVFHIQLINSVVNHLTDGGEESDSVAFMIRSELLRRSRECMTDHATKYPSAAELSIAVTAIIFFKGDIQACVEQWEKATNEDEDFYYDVELDSFGRTTIKSIGL